MTQDEIIRMARDAGSIDSEDTILTIYAAFSNKKPIKDLTDKELAEAVYGKISIELMDREYQVARAVIAADREKNK